MATNKFLHYFSPNFASYSRKTLQPSSMRSLTPSHVHGFTLLELLVSVALLGVLLASAAPSFGAAIDRSKLRASSLEIFESLALARSTAISQNKIVFVCYLDSNRQCVVSNKRNHPWKQGWQVFVDENRNNEFDANDSILFNGKASTSVSIIFNQSGRLRFFPNGSARSAGFYVCGPNLNATTHLKLLHTGRLRIAKEASEKAKSICKTML